LAFNGNPGEGTPARWLPLADALGISSNNVSNWETGSTSPRQESVKKLLVMRK
jgi:predicted transcriptional regulator